MIKHQAEIMLGKSGFIDVLHPKTEINYFYYIRAPVCCLLYFLNFLLDI